MTATILSGVAGVILSLLFSYIPKLNTKFAAKTEEEKKLWMLGLLVLVAGAAFGLSCTKYGLMIGIPVQCTDAGLIELGKVLAAAAIANQTAFALTPQTKKVKAAKATAKATAKAAALAASVKRPAG